MFLYSSLGNDLPQLVSLKNPLIIMVAVSFLRKTFGKGTHTKMMENRNVLKKWEKSEEKP